MSTKITWLGHAALALETWELRSIWRDLLSGEIGLWLVLELVKSLTLLGGPQG